MQLSNISDDRDRECLNKQVRSTMALKEVSPRVDTTLDRDGEEVEADILPEW